MSNSVVVTLDLGEVYRRLREALKVHKWTPIRFFIDGRITHDHLSRKPYSIQFEMMDVKWGDDGGLKHNQVLFYEHVFDTPELLDECFPTELDRAIEGFLAMALLVLPEGK